jgi:hypothetical protein
MRLSRETKKNGIPIKYLVAIFVPILVLALFVINKRAFKRFYYSQIRIIKENILDQSFLVFHNESCPYHKDNFKQDLFLDTLDFKLPPKTVYNIQKDRKYFLNQYYLGREFLNVSQGFNYHKASCKVNSRKIDLKIKLFGMFPDHIENKSKYSFRAKAKNSNIFGITKFNILKPNSRGYQVDFMANKAYKNMTNGIEIFSQPVFTIMNKEVFGVMVFEEFYDKVLIERNFYRENTLFEVHKDAVSFNYIPSNLDTSFYNGLFKNDSLKHLVDIDKFITCLAISIVNNSKHNLEGINLHWYHNPVNNKLQPTIRELKLSRLDSFEFNTPKVLYRSNWMQLSKFSTIKYADFTSNLVSNLIINKKLNKDILGDKILNVIDEYRKILESNEYKKYVISFDKQHHRYLVNNENILKQNFKLLESKIKKSSYKPHFAKSPTKVIYIINDTQLTKDLVIENTQSLIVQPGVRIEFLNNSKLFIYGDLKAIGSKIKPIVFNATQSVSSIYISAKRDVKLNYCSFLGFSAFKKGSWKLPSGITFYETNFAISNCFFSENKFGDDYLNIFRCKNFKILNSTFHNVLNDAVDSDFSSGKIDNCKFVNIGNDGIDGSGSEISITQCSFEKVMDKAISCGEGSKFFVNHITISNSAIGFVSKDKSELIIYDFILQGNKLDFCSFQKKKEYGPGAIFFKTVDFKNTNFLFQEKSKVFINNTPAGVNFVQNVEDKLYGAIYGKASKK